MIWMNCRRYLLTILVAGSIATSSTAQQSMVIGTVHNLSASGPGEIRAVSEPEVCKFCHVPHNAVVPVPLWSRSLSKATYEVPEVSSGSERQRTAAPQPDGSSRLCLSCHDGTIALGDLPSEPRPIAMMGASSLRPGQRGFLGTDLSGSHPISIEMREFGPSSDSEPTDMTVRPVASIESGTGVALDSAGRIQCTTCHDPHSDANYKEGVVPHFWVASSVDEVCLTCHVPR